MEDYFLSSNSSTKQTNQKWKSEEHIPKESKMGVKSIFPKVNHVDNTSEVLIRMYSPFLQRSQTFMNSLVRFFAI